MAGTLKVGTITTPSGSGTITIPSGVTLLSNTPAFIARITSNQTLPTDTFAKVTWDTTDLDTDNAFDVSNNRFTVPSNKGGTYLLNTSLAFNLPTVSDDLYVYLYKNGSSFRKYQAQLAQLSDFQDTTLSPTFILNASAGDYFEIFARSKDGSNNKVFADSVFTGFKIGA